MSSWATRAAEMRRPAQTYTIEDPVEKLGSPSSEKPDVLLGKIVDAVRAALQGTAHSTAEDLVTARARLQSHSGIKAGIDFDRKAVIFRGPGQELSVEFPSDRPVFEIRLQTSGRADKVLTLATDAYELDGRMQSLDMLFGPDAALITLLKRKLLDMPRQRAAARVARTLKSRGTPEPMRSVEMQVPEVDIETLIQRLTEAGLQSDVIRMLPVLVNIEKISKTAQGLALRYNNKELILHWNGQVTLSGKPQKDTEKIDAELNEFLTTIYSCTPS